MSSITLERVSKTFPGGGAAARGLDLAIEDGAFVCVVGPSGCGKSTVLNMIAGLEEPTEGRILFDGAPVTHLGPPERNVAMVFQSYALYPHKTVRENLAFPLRMAKVPREEIEKRVIQAACRLAIEPLLDRLPRALSGGQRQRVALGRALVRRPRAFLLDEPLSNLDAALRGEMRAEIKRLHQDLGATFVYVTHDQAEAMTLSDRVAVLRAGTLMQYAPPREVYERPASLFVARFLGSPPMNVLEGRIEGGAFRSEAGAIPLEGRALPPGDAFLGARAEDARLDPAGPLAGRIFVVEPMGAETLVTVEVAGGARVICRAPASFEGKRGEAVRVAVDASRAHLFAKWNEERIG